MFIMQIGKEIKATASTKTGYFFGLLTRSPDTCSHATSLIHRNHIKSEAITSSTIRGIGFGSIRNREEDWLSLLGSLELQDWDGIVNAAGNEIGACLAIAVTFQESHDSQSKNKVRISFASAV